MESRIAMVIPAFEDLSRAYNITLDKAAYIA